MKQNSCHACGDSARLDKWTDCMQRVYHFYTCSSACREIIIQKIELNSLAESDEFGFY